MARNKYPEVTVERILDTAEQLFWEQGYENTTIQNIVDALGDLSKGAIYHHFKSKEEIIDAVASRFYHDSASKVAALKSAKDKSGLEKLRSAFEICLVETDQSKLLHTAPCLMKNPKILAMQLYSSVEEVAPGFIQPLVEQGIADGSLQADYPAELAQVLMLLANIWLNPMVFDMDQAQLARRFAFLEQLTIKLGAPVLDHSLLPEIEALRQLLEQIKKEKATVPDKGVSTE